MYGVRSCASGFGLGFSVVGLLMVSSFLLLLSGFSLPWLVYLHFDSNHALLKLQCPMHTGSQISGTALGSSTIYSVQCTYSLWETENAPEWYTFGRHPLHLAWHLHMHGNSLGQSYLWPHLHSLYPAQSSDHHEDTSIISVMTLKQLVMISCSNSNFKLYDRYCQKLEAHWGSRTRQ